jgi:hypothetical protein
MKLNRDQIINEYKSKNFTLVDLANKYEVDYRRIRTILVKNNIEIINGNKIKPVSEERKLKMSKIKKEMFASGKLKIWCKGKKRNKIDLYKNMKAHLKYEIELEWLMKYEDIEKLKQAFNGAKYIFHLAAFARVVPSIHDPMTFHNINVN